MTFDKTDNDSMLLSCALSPEEQEYSANEENCAERQERLSKLRDQIRAGTYRPAIGEIAVNLIRPHAKISGFN
ncbi:flagellar biosynthesis anti-sigma factor FlgM [Maridesulfovibrio sp.]|uniref:flagellar biosynthesis anti-sigma factor FlgM n=1 Tax=Maridesulfovibrio sp. TaxID=2795000 RepID=UPI0029F5C5DC|nr:flagellar biosynthesis anti-sigma factor FlgM [Maridesulfovibrio sp.]